MSVKSDAVKMCRIMVAFNAGSRQSGLLHPVKNSPGRDKAFLGAPAFDPSMFGPLVVTGRQAGGQELHRGLLGSRQNHVSGAIPALGGGWTAIAKTGACWRVKVTSAIACAFCACNAV